MSDLHSHLSSLITRARRVARRPVRPIILSTLAGLAIYLLYALLTAQVESGETLGPLLGRSPISRPVRGGIDRDTRLPNFLWSYVPGLEESLLKPAEEGGWTWVNSQRRKGYRRPSWGGLAQQGARKSMRTNLKEDRQYLTLFHVAGWNNQIIAMSNSIFLALKTGRIPILTPFVPASIHLHHHATWLSVMEVFDMTELVNRYNVPIVDMLELKVANHEMTAKRHTSLVYDGEVMETYNRHLGSPRKGDTIPAETPGEDHLECWSFLLTGTSQAGPIGVPVATPMSVGWTPLPRNAFFPRADKEHQSSMNATANIITSFAKAGDILPADSIQRLEELSLAPSKMQPNEQITCFDRLFFIHTEENSEIRHEWRKGVGAWDAVGKYLRFQPGLIRLAQDLVRSLLGVPWDQPVPLYLAVHIRRTDLKGAHRDMTPRQWSYQAWQMLHEFQRRQGIRVTRILFTTDEKDQAWLDELRVLGWVMVDHVAYRTGNRLDWWMPTILDSVILSTSQLFLGVEGSTMSILPYRRVIDWTEGSGMARFADPLQTLPDDWEWREDW